jgi:hypothetical protein
MAGYKGSPVMQRLLRRQKLKQSTAVTPTATKPKEEGKDGKKQSK